MNDTPVDSKKARRNKIIIFLLLGFPVLAVGVSTFMFKTGYGVPTGTTNNGVLVQPAKQIDPLNLSSATGEPYSYKKGAKWTFILPQSSNCDESCKERLYFTRQVHIAVGKNATALRRVYLNTDKNLDTQMMGFIEKEHPRMQVVNVDAEEWKEFSKDFDPNMPEKKPFYLVDPAGFVMMRYTTESTYKEILVDLKKLISKVGGH